MISLHFWHFTAIFCGIPTGDNGLPCWGREVTSSCFVCKTSDIMSYHSFLFGLTRLIASDRANPFPYQGKREACPYGGDQSRSLHLLIEFSHQAIELLLV